MITPRLSARIVGILFIFAIVTLFIGQALYDSVLTAPDYLQTVYPNRGAVTSGVLIEFMGILGLVLLAAFVYPILKKHNEYLAMGYVGFRLLEVILLTAAQINKLILINLSRRYLQSGGDGTEYFMNMGESVKSVLFWNDSGGLIYLIVFIIGAVILYSVFYRSKLIPRWLSVFGLVSVAAMLPAAVIGSVESLPVSIAVVLMIPLPVQETVMGIWLIAKGFNKATLE